MAERRAKYEAQLEMPPFPMALAYLWRTYNRLRRRKGSSGFGASPIEWTDIEAFLRVTRTSLMSWEISALERIDDAFLAGVRKARSDSEE